MRNDRLPRARASYVPVRGTGACSDKQKKIRIALVIWSLDQGGAEQVVMNLAAGAEGIYEPFVICLNEKGPYAARLEERGIKVIAMKKRPGIDPGLVFRLRKVLLDEKAALVHTHLFTSNLWGRLAAFFAGIPAVITEHNMDVWKNGMHFLLDRILSLVTARAVFVSRKVAEYYGEKVPGLKKKSEVIYNGIDHVRFNLASAQKRKSESFGLPAESVVFGIVGRLVPQKAHADFIDAIGRLIAAGFPAAGLIVGDGPERKSLEDLVQSRGLRDAVKFTGFLTEMTAAYAVMDVFTLSSLREGFPMTMLEAMASGLPVVATDVGGVSECIEDGEEGFLVQPGKPETLAAAMQKMLEDSGLRRNMGMKAARKVEERFSIRHMVQSHAELYFCVVNAAGGARP